MSYILDALKKNKSDNDQDKVPDLSSEHGSSAYDYDEYEEESVFSRWLWPVVVMVLLLTIGVLGFMLLNPSAEQVSKQIVQQPAVSQKSSQPESSSVSSTKSEPVEAERYSDTVITKKPLEVAAPVVQRKARQSFNSNDQAAKDNPQKTTQAKSSAVTKDDLPKLTYTTHIYATQSKDRFVMINGRALSEGDTISKSLTIKEILENDLVVIFKGQEFVLPALEDVNVD